MHISFDAMLSHDITYVGIIQTARASGMNAFPIPYVLTNCHNSLCAVGGTINEDDHAFGLSAAKKYGGIYVPANTAVIHQYAREQLVKCGAMLLGSDSHTRYGCYGCMGIGEGGGELVKQLLRNTWDVDLPKTILVWLEGKLSHGVGPHDVALSLVSETFPDGFAKNAVLEFAGPGMNGLSMDFRAGIDVMTTETGCLSSIWETDGKVREYYECVGRPDDYVELRAGEGARYDGMVSVDLSKVECMIALPFHPSKAYPIRELKGNAHTIFKEIQADGSARPGSAKPDLLSCIGPDGEIHCEQGVIVGCAGGLFENIHAASDILEGGSVGNGYFDLSVYPSSAPVNLALLRDGTSAKLAESGAVIKPCFCGPCFGAGDTPANNTLSIRHATRNFPNREGSRPWEGQSAMVALMDARSIAATARNGGVLTAASEIDYEEKPFEYRFDASIYEKRVYDGFGKPESGLGLRFGPNIADWPEMPELKEDLLLNFCAVIDDPVTTTDELIPSGETSSYRSNPIRLSDHALSRRVPAYAAASKRIRALAEGSRLENVSVGSCVAARRPGDGSAREQAASCQKVLGGLANVAVDYATKRYRSNCINWGIVPFTLAEGENFDFTEGSWLFVPGIREGLLTGREEYCGVLLKNRDENIPSTEELAAAVEDLSLRRVRLLCKDLSRKEAEILTEGCLINHYKTRTK